MSGTNQFIPFCPIDTGSNLLTEIEYSGSTDRVSGNKPGIASAKLNNKALRQANAIAAAVAQFMADWSGDDILDNGNGVTLLASVVKTFKPTSVQKAADYTLTTADYFIGADDSSASFNLTLPAVAAANNGRTYKIKKIANNVNHAVTLVGTIDGAANTTLNTFGEEIELISDYNGGVGATWRTVQRKVTTPWVAYTPTITSGFGTVTSNQAFWRRIGDSVEVQGSFIAGTVSANPATVSLPSGLSLDTAKLPTISSPAYGAFQLIGVWSDDHGFAGYAHMALYSSSVYFALLNATTPGMSPFNINGVVTSSNVISYRFMLPISGWNA